MQGENVSEPERLEKFLVCPQCSGNGQKNHKSQTNTKTQQKKSESPIMANSHENWTKWHSEGTFLATFFFPFIWPEVPEKYPRYPETNQYIWVAIQDFREKTWKNMEKCGKMRKNAEKCGKMRTTIYPPDLCVYICIYFLCTHVSLMIPPFSNHTLNPVPFNIM